MLIWFILIFVQYILRAFVSVGGKTNFQIFYHPKRNATLTTFAQES